VVIFNPPEFEGPAHYLEGRTTVVAGDDFSFNDIIFLEIKIALTFGANNLVPVGDTAGIPSCHESTPTGRTLQKGFPAGLETK
jgi:hypothetical protein